MKTKTKCIKRQPPLPLTLLIVLSTFYSFSQSPNPGFATTGGNIAYKGDYVLIFHDESEGNSLNTKKWITWFPDHCGDEKPDEWGIQDPYSRLSSEDGLQIYSNENVVIKDGYCSLIAKKESSTWAKVTRN